MKIKIKKLVKEAKLPEQSSEEALGYDIFTIERGIVPTQGKVVFKTGLALSIPKGYGMLLWPRSGLSVQPNVVYDIGAGCIDSDYRGELKVVVQNSGRAPLRIAVGDAICQMIIIKQYTAEFEEVSELDETPRGDKGFGSTTAERKEKIEDVRKN